MTRCVSWDILDFSALVVFISLSLGFPVPFSTEESGSGYTWKCWFRVGECLVWEALIPRWDREGAKRVLSAGFIADLKLSTVTKLLFLVPSCLVQRDMRKKKDFFFLSCSYCWIVNFPNKYCFKDQLLTILINITSVTFHMMLLCVNKMERKNIDNDLDNDLLNFCSYMQLLGVNRIWSATKLLCSMPADTETSFSFIHFIKISAYLQ